MCALEGFLVLHIYLPPVMANDAVLRTSLIWLAAIMALTGLYTQSLNKTAATYLFGMLAIAGVLLPDWNFFDRPVSQWCTLLADHDSQSATPPRWVTHFSILIATLINSLFLLFVFFLLFLSRIIIIIIITKGKKRYLMI